jgi:CubicO group peptidase (beta-lactamase class C family)
MVVTEWQARHGLSAEAYQQAFDELVSQGHRLVKVAGVCVADEPRYAGIWQKRRGHPWQARHGLSEAGYQQAVALLAGEGYRPTHVSAFRCGGSTLFSAIWEREPGLEWVARHGLTAGQYQAVFDQLVEGGYRLRCVSGYEVAGEARYAAIWDRYAGPPWQARHGLDSAAYQSEFDRLVGEEFRLIQVSGYPVGSTIRFAAIWEQSPGHSWRARHGIAAATYQAEFDAEVRRGYRLVDVSAYAAGSTEAYTTIWEDAGPDEPSADAVSAFAIPFMQASAVPGLSLAVGRKGTPVASRAYGYANPITREIVTPRTRFRIASVAKPITATAVFRLIEQGRLKLDDQVFGEASLLGTRYGTTPYGAHITDITVRHLLEHTAGGWGNDANDPMFRHPSLDHDALIGWTLDHVPLIDAPGVAWRYSNFGYCLLGRVIEAATGVPYDAHVRASVLTPAGSSAMVIGGDAASERASSEALYKGQGDQNPYGMPVRRMDSHGGWIGSPGDLLRFLARVDSFPSPPDLLAAATITTMTTPSSVRPDYAKGWSVTGAGTVWHIGGLPGTQSILVRLANGHEWAAVCNTGGPYPNVGLELDQLMWKIDSVV